MKKVFTFLLFTGLILGLFLGIRNVALRENPIEVQETVVEVYNDSLNLPLIEVDSMNPILTKNKNTADTLKLIYEPLIDIDEGNKAKLCLASQIVQKDDLNWLVKIKENVEWHGGQAFTIDDVIYTLVMLKNDGIDSMYKENVSNIENFDKISETTMSIKLKEKNNNFSYTLTFPIIPKYYFGNDLYNREKALRPVGTGPYKYLSNETETNIMTLVYNQKWWNSVTPKLSKIYLYSFETYGEAIKAFKSSQIDVISTTMTSWDKKFGIIGLNSYSYENTEFETVLPNVDKVALNDNSVLKAILYSINREKIIVDVYNGNAEVCDSAIHRNTLKDTEYDIEKAKQLLINSGWNIGNSGWSKNIDGQTYILKFNLMVNKLDEEKLKVAECVKECLAEIKIPITIIKVDEATLVSNIESKKYDLALVSYNVAFDYDGSNLKESTSCIGMYFKTNTLITNKAVKGEITPTWWNIYNNIWTFSK